MGPRRRRDMRLARLAVAAVTVVSLPRFLLDSTDSIQPMGPALATAVAVWWCLPAVALVVASRVPSVAVVGGLAYLVTCALAQASVYRTTHSTAAVGLVVWPVYLAVGIGVVLGLERLVLGSRPPSGSGHRP